VLCLSSFVLPVSSLACFMVFCGVWSFGSMFSVLVEFKSLLAEPFTRKQNLW
jgi:hypothetical protein